MKPKGSVWELFSVRSSCRTVWTWSADVLMKEFTSGLHVGASCCWCMFTLKNAGCNCIDVDLMTMTILNITFQMKKFYELSPCLVCSISCHSLLKHASEPSHNGALDRGGFTSKISTLFCTSTRVPWWFHFVLEQLPVEQLSIAVQWHISYLSQDDKHYLFRVE